ncbi:MAG: hybrid sensor histidine kinase/response regulator [Myxococcales bacterium]|nr:hybrid sensor histidine kinase/response regulator [Myxococcales bacterium]
MSLKSLPWLAGLLGLPWIEWKAGAEGTVERLQATLALSQEDARLALMEPDASGSSSVSTPEGLVVVRQDAEGGFALRLPRSDTTQRLEQVDLLAGVSHELANAFSSIAGWAQLANAHPVPDEVTEALSRIQQAALGADRTARHMLAMARGEGSDLEETLRVNDVIEDVTRLLIPKARAARVALETKHHGEHHVEMRGVDLVTIIWNLVQNAIEAAPSGTAVQIASKRVGSLVFIEVMDEGPGIPHEDRHRIFERYVTSKATGTGLGLHLVKGAAERGRGSVNVDASPGGGARFLVRLPAKSAPEEQRTAVMPGTGRPGRVLVLEDDRSIRDLLETVIGSRGHRVIGYPSAGPALEDGRHYDLVIADLGLADLRGDEAIARLRTDGRGDLAIIMSGGEEPGDIHPEGRPTAWLRKPFELDELEGLVIRFLEETTPS